MVMLCLDISTNCGWAYGVPWSGVPRMVVGTWKLPKGATHQQRSHAIARELAGFLRGQPVDIAGIEIPQKGMAPRIVKTVGEMGDEFSTIKGGTLDSQNLLWSLNGAAQAVFAINSIPVRDIGVKEWRKDIFGNGNIKGDESKRRSKAELIRYGIDVSNQDEAEAGMMLVWLNNRRRRVMLEVGAQRA